MKPCQTCPRRRWRKRSGPAVGGASSSARRKSAVATTPFPAAAMGAMLLLAAALSPLDAALQRRPSASRGVRLEAPQQLHSSLFLYRGGSDGDSEEVGLDSDGEQRADGTADGANDGEAAAADLDRQVEASEGETIQVTSAVASSPDAAVEAAMVEASAHSPAPRKKSNAVGDPDGNSSDDESASDLDEEMHEEEWRELTELERELMELELERRRSLRQQGQGAESVDDDIGEGAAGFETLVEMTERREGMKRRIDEIEAELRRRRGDESDGVLLDLDAEGEEEEGEHEAGERGTSYHLAGTDVTKEDELLRRQRKYKRGSIFKDSPRRGRKSSNVNNVNSASPKSSAAAKPTIPTTIDSTTFDNMLVSAFRSMVFLPPPSPRLPSPGGSASLRNVDVASRRRLDRRTLYHGLLAELGGSHHRHDRNGGEGEKTATRDNKNNAADAAVRRRYLDAGATRSLRGALSLACQPRWRERLTAAPQIGDGPSKRNKKGGGEGDGLSDEEEDHSGGGEEEPMPSWWYRGGVCLFPSDDDAMAAGGGQGGGASPPPQLFAPQGIGGMGGVDGDGAMGQGRFFGPETNEDENASEPSAVVKPWKCTMGMQETVAAALAHSLLCGLALIDDEALADVRGAVEGSLARLAEEEAGGEGGERAPPPTINPEELRNSALLGHLVRLADEGKLSRAADDCSDQGGGGGERVGSGFGRISHRMTRDLELGLDDPNDDLAVTSLRLMKEDEQHWFNPVDVDDENANDGRGKGEEEADSEIGNPPLSLVLFLRSDSSPSILKSKSAVERLAHECVRKDGIHLLMLGGKGVDASTTSLPNERDMFGGQGAASGRMRQFIRQPSMTGNDTPFSFMSNYPPGHPDFNAHVQNNQQQQQQQHPFQGQFQGGYGGAHFNANNANASGVNDPEGSRRFNIFLARTVDPTGKPQIMGTIASPAAGNLFPTILANMAKENLRKIHEKGLDEDNEQQVMFVRQMEELASQAEAHMTNGHDGSDGDSSAGSDGASTNAAFFNATITSPFGSEIFHSINQSTESGKEGAPGEQFTKLNLPPEHVRRAIQDAMSGVIDRLAQMSATSSGTANNIPMSIARAFSQVLSNENLRRGIAENLSRAAPAFIDPRCQGVMLSVYVPPGPEHPNRGMMPGDQFHAKGSDKQQPPKQQPQEKGIGSVPHGMGGWLNKILSSSDKSKHVAEDEDSASVASVEAEDTVIDVDKVNVKETDEKQVEKETSIEHQRMPTKSSKRKKSKRERNLDRARTLAVAAAALAGAKKNRKEIKSAAAGGGVGGNRQQNAKLTPEQKAQRNLQRLQTLCRTVPLQCPVDPVRARSWDAWISREEGSVIFRKNRSVLRSILGARNLDIDAKSGTKGAGTVLRQMMSVREIVDKKMEEAVRCAVEMEAGKSQRHHESPWGLAKSPAAAINKPSKHVTDKSLVNFLCDDDVGNTTAVEENAQKSNSRARRTTQFIHPNSLEAALSLVCGVSPSPGSQGSSSSALGGSLASHRTKEDLLALATDKHERALVPNCVSPQDIGVTYDMIGGLGEVKELLRQSITYPLKFPHLYSEGIAREAVKGVLLFGPPGTGKTMLAKAVATEGGASFLSVDASSVENKWLGESEKNAKAVFTLARRLAPCVIFIDEVDSLLSSREGSSDDSAHGTLTSVKTTMMSEWDGLNSGTNGKGDAGSDRVVVIGSTNRPFDLDEAVLRRFPRRILVDLPDLETRREILEVTLAENRLGSDVNLTLIAERLEGYTGSDLKEVSREAVVQISHEQARMLDRGEQLMGTSDTEGEDYPDMDAAYGASLGSFQMLRPVTMQDFENAMRKLKRSVSETGRELAKVWEWNDEYGEIKKVNKREVLPQMMNMFL